MRVGPLRSLLPITCSQPPSPQAQPPAGVLVLSPVFVEGHFQNILLHHAMGATPLIREERLSLKRRWSSHGPPGSHMGPGGQGAQAGLALKRPSAQTPPPAPWCPAGSARGDTVGGGVLAPATCQAFDLGFSGAGLPLSPRVLKSGLRSEENAFVPPTVAIQCLETAFGVTVEDRDLALPQTLPEIFEAAAVGKVSLWASQSRGNSKSSQGLWGTRARPAFSPRLPTAEPRCPACGRGSGGLGTSPPV